MHRGLAPLVRLASARGALQLRGLSFQEPPMSRALLLLLAAAPALAQTTSHRQERLGTIGFHTSGAAAAQADFNTGVLYMHSFEYELAADAFRAAQANDPGYAMAYWGEAMSHTHPLWNEQDSIAARSVLARLAPTREARAAKAPTARERAWLDAVEILYGEGSKPRRDTLYARAMERLAAEYPDDEARAFLALAYLGLNQAVRDVPSYMRAGAIALDILQRNPDHPGAAHYAIHAFDDPAHAPLGLGAAQAYSGIAPGAAHAQHMTTHIFLAMGMWPEVISQNTIASGPDRERWTASHYTYWLHYGLLQSGRIDEATALLDELHAHEGSNPSRRGRVHLALARAQQAVTAERWNDPALAWPLASESLHPIVAAVDEFTRGFSALQVGDVKTAATAAATLERNANSAGADQIPGLLARQLQAALSRARGDTSGAELQLRAVASAAAALPVEFGPPDFVKPPYELLGEWLLADGRPADARQAFEAALALMPERLLSLRGLKQANEALAVAAR
jgi:tetratricopeptide (TPR) repeat protein